MSRLIFGDSSGFIAQFVGSDSYHQAANREIRRLLREGRILLTTNYIFDEVVTRVHRLAGHSEAVAVGERLLESRVIERVFIDEELEARAWKLYRKYKDQPLSFTDVTSVAVMERHGIREVLTFDDDFTRVGFVRLPRDQS